MVGRSFKLRLAAILALITIGPLYLAGISHATSRNQIELVCPICATRFSASVIGSTNTFGGVDSDLLGRATGRQAEPFYLASCPTCRYTTYHADFKDLGEQTEIVRRVLSEMENLTPNVSSDKLPGSEKYTIAMKIYSALGKDSRTIGDLLLRAAWCRRLEGPKILTFSSSLGRSYTTAMKNLESLLEKQNVELVWNDIQSYLKAFEALDSLSLGMAPRETGHARDFLKVYFLQRLGENVKAMQVLNAIEKDADPKTWPAQLAEAVWKGISEEMVFHRQAVLEFRKALARKIIPPDELAITYYLIGENLHRAGRDKEAVQWFRRALDKDDIPDWLTPIAQQQLSLVIR